MKARVRMTEYGLWAATRGGYISYFKHWNDAVHYAVTGKFSGE